MVSLENSSPKQKHDYWSTLAIKSSFVVRNWIPGIKCSHIGKPLYREKIEDIKQISKDTVRM